MAEAVSAEEWTVARVVTWATEDFKRRGLDSPRLDAELLLAHVLGVDRVKLFVDFARVLEPRELVAYRDLIQRRRKAEPVAYILGTREFHGLPLRVDRRVLVPRPDTETLVEVALDRTAAFHLQGSALDVCTGSGCVALAFAKRRPTWSVTGSDVSEEALAVARDNAERVGASVRFVSSDLDAAFPAGTRFDVITANPPYIPTGELEGLPPDVRDHEPRLALDGGRDGLDVIRRVVKMGAARLTGGGVLAVEVHYDQAARVTALFEEAGYRDVDRRMDYGGIERVVSGRRDG
jgi:release factor glutamine methyltransferase